jgi:hypothetical protein
MSGNKVSKCLKKNKDSSAEVYCDFCGNTTDVLTHSSVPDRFGYYNFCRTGDCYTNYHNYIYKNDTSRGKPYSTKQLLLDIDTKTLTRHVSINAPCDFCGDTEDVRRHIDVPDKFEHYNFCNYKECYSAYDRFIYRKDLSDGIPYSIKIDYPLEKKDQHRQCAYCGRESVKVLKVHSAPFYLRYKSFCKNARCYKLFHDYHISRPPPHPYKDPFRSSRNFDLDEVIFSDETDVEFDETD